MAPDRRSVGFSSVASPLQQVARDVKQPGEVFRAPGRADLRDAVAGVYEVPLAERPHQGLSQLAEWRTGMLPPASMPLPLPVQAGTQVHRRDPGPAQAARGLAMRGQWQQALREFVQNDEQLNGQVLLSAHKLVKGGGCANLNYALSTMTDMSWSVMVMFWEAWQDGKLPTVFDAERSEALFKTRYHELAQQFHSCRAAWLAEISGYRDQKRQQNWDAGMQNAHEAAFQHDVFEFIPEATLAEEHRPYFKKALQECVKMALTAGGDAKTKLLLERIAELEAELAAAMEELDLLRDQDREREEGRKEYFKKPLRPKEPPPQVVQAPRPHTVENEAQTDFKEPEAVVVEKEGDNQDAWRLQAEQERNAKLQEELRRLEALLRERDEEIEALKRSREDLEEALGNQLGTRGRLEHLEKEHEQLLEKQRQLKQQLEESEAELARLREQLEAALANKPMPVREKKPATKVAAVQTNPLPTEAPAAKPKRVKEAGAQTDPPPPKAGSAEAEVQTDPLAKRRQEEKGVQADLEEPPAGDDGRLLRQIQELKRQLAEERERYERLEQEMERRLSEERERYQQLEQEMQRQLELGLNGSKALQAEIERRTKQLQEQRDEARRLLEKERERTRQLEAALQALRDQLEILRRKLEALGADVGEVDAVLEDELLQQVTKPKTRVFDRLWNDAQDKERRKKEREAEALIYAAAYNEAVMKMQKNPPTLSDVEGGSWLFADPHCDTACPCCGKPCNSAALASGAWKASEDPEGTASGTRALPGSAAQTGTSRPAAGARLASPHSRSPRLGAGPGAARELSAAAAEGLGEEVVVKSLTSAFEEAAGGRRALAGPRRPSQDFEETAFGASGGGGRGLGGDLGRGLGADPGRGLGGDPGRGFAGDLGRGPAGDLGRGLGGDLGRGSPGDEAAAEEGGRRARGAAASTPSRVEARAAGLAGGGLSFLEHCRRQRDGAVAPPTPAPEELAEAPARESSKSVQLSHLLLAEHDTPLPPRTPDVAVVWPATGLMSSMVPSIRPSNSSPPASIPPGVRPSTSTKRSATLLPSIAQKEEPSPAAASSTAVAAAETLAPTRPLPRRWLDQSFKQQTAGSGAAEGGACASPSGSTKSASNAAVQRSRSSSQLPSSSTPTAQGGGRRASPPYPSIPISTSASQPKLDRCSARCCGGLPAAAPKR